LSYQNSILGNLDFNFGTGIGAYLIYSTSTITQINAYVEDYYSWKKGDIRKNVWSSHFTAATAGGEGSIGFVYRLTPSLSLGITGRLILISKIENIAEYTDYYETEWDPAEPKLMTIKEGEEYGGMGWGIDVSVIF
jgi:hypothetical protein